jgi:hypothetical protein
MRGSANPASASSSFPDCASLYPGYQHFFVMPGTSLDKPGHDDIFFSSVGALWTDAMVP